MNVLKAVGEISLRYKFDISYLERYHDTLVYA